MKDQSASSTGKDESILNGEDALLPTVIVVSSSQKSNQNKKDEGDQVEIVADGGCWAMLVCFASFWTNGTIFGVNNSVGILYDDLKEQYGNISSFRLSLAGSLCIGMTFLFSPVAAILTDLFGIRIITCIGGVLVTLGMLISAFIDELEVLYVTYGLILGIGMSLAYTPSLVILGHYYKRNLGLVNGIVTAGSSVFTMALPPFLTWTLSEIKWKGTLLVLSGAMSAIILAAYTFKPVLPSRKKTVSAVRRQTSGCEAFCNRFLNMEIWRNRKYVVWAIAIPSALFGYFIPYVYLVHHVRHLLPEVNGSILVTCIGATSGVGRILFGFLTDRTRVNRIVLQQISFVTIGVLTMLLTLANAFWALVLICLGLGLCDGCFISLLGPIAFDIVGASNASQAIGFLLGLCSIPLTLGPPIAGILYDSTGSYTVPFIVAGIPPIIGAGIMFIISRVKTENPKVEVCENESIIKSGSTSVSSMPKNEPENADPEAIWQKAPVNNGQPRSTSMDSGNPETLSHNSEESAINDQIQNQINLKLEKRSLFIEKESSC